PGEFDPERKRLVDDIRRFLDSRKLPALVVHLPSRDTLLHPTNDSLLHFEKAKTFAKALGAQFLDGGKAFEGLSAAEIRARFLPHDGHWNQKGSDQFAAFIVRNLNLLN